MSLPPKSREMGGRGRERSQLEKQGEKNKVGLERGREQWREGVSEVNESYLLLDTASIKE